LIGGFLEKRGFDLILRPDLTDFTEKCKFHSVISKKIGTGGAFSFYATESSDIAAQTKMGARFNEAIQ
jgi:hypothetical protein